MCRQTEYLQTADRSMYVPGETLVNGMKQNAFFLFPFFLFCSKILKKSEWEKPT